MPPDLSPIQVGLRAARGLAAVAVALAVGCTAAPPPEPAAAPSPASTSAPATAAPTDLAHQAACNPPCRRRPRVAGSYATSLAPEASGIASSRRNPGLLYVLDDGPGTTSLLVIRARNARAVGQVEVAGLTGTDTEGLAVGPCSAGSDESCVFVGDIGDNVRGRDSVTVTRFVEPVLDGGPAGAVPSRTVMWRYPDGPHDAEALLVGPDGTLAVITKAAGRSGRGAGRLYTTPRFADATLARGPRLRLPQPAVPLAAAVVGNVVTAADSSEIGVVVRTYDAVYEFTAPAEAELLDFPSWPVREIRGPSEAQGEAVAYGVDGCRLFTVSEGSGQLTVIPCR